jgi:hypothetical protein
MALLHQRFLFAWGIIAAPILCRQISRQIPQASGRFPLEADRSVPNAAFILASLFVAWFAFPAQDELAAQVRAGNPVEAVEVIRRTHPTGRMLNEYVYGGYLSWALPDHKVFIDGRADVYAWTGVLQDYGAWATLQEDPSRLLDQYRIDFCLLSEASPMVRAMRYLPGWREQYSDSHAVIFVRSGAR